MHPDIRATLADALIKVTIVLTAGGAIAAAMASATAARRHLIWLLTICAALFMPVLCVLSPAWQVLPTWADHGAINRSRPVASLEMPLPHSEKAVGSRMPASLESKNIVDIPSSGSALSESPVRQLVLRGAPNAITDAPRRSHVLAFSIALISSAGCAVLLTRVVISFVVLRNLAGRAVLVDSGPLADLLAKCCVNLGLRRRVELRMGGRHGMPMTWGIITPIVLLPAEAAHWQLGRVRLALLHELAHIKRWDALTQFITRLACAAYWFHPLIWVAAAGLRREQERAADDRVLSLDSCGPNYASFLLELAAGRSWAGGDAAIAMGRPAALEGRLRAILDDRRRREPLSLGTAFVAVTIAAAFVAPIAALHGQLQATQPQAASSQPADAGTVRYAGHILAPDGTPAAGAEVLLRGYSAKWNRTDALVAARSDANGAFVLQTAPQTKTPLMPRIQAWAPGFAPVSVVADVGEDQVVRLAAPSSVRVVVFGPDGMPVPGLRVRPSRTIASSSLISRMAGPLQLLYYPPDWSTRFARTTGADGACIFDMLPRVSRTTLEIDDERFAQLPVGDDTQTGTGPQSDQVTFHLKQAGVISGKVTYGPTGKPASGISLLAMDRNSAGGGSFGAEGEIVINEHGEYRIHQVREGNYVIHVLCHDDIGWTATFLKDVHVTPGQTTSDQNLVLVKGTVVHGRVYEADTGNPYPDADVNAVDLNTNEYPGGTKTDAQGRFVLRVPPGRQGFYLAKRPPDGYSSEEFDGRSHRRIAANGVVDTVDGSMQFLEITAVDGVDQSIEMKLSPKPGKPVAGRVVDAGGKPVSGVAVRAVEKDEEDELFSGTSVPTDSEGRFHFRALAPGAKLSVTARDNSGTLVPVKVEGGEQNVVIHVARNAKTTVTGIVVDPAGKPVADAAIRLSVMWERMGMSDGQPAIFTDSAGRFTIPNLPPDAHYSISIRAGVFGAGVELNFTPGEETHDMGTISLNQLTYAK